MLSCVTSFELWFWTLKVVSLRKTPKSFRPDFRFLLLSKYNRPEFIINIIGYNVDTFCLLRLLKFMNEL